MKRRKCLSSLVHSWFGTKQVRNSSRKAKSLNLLEKKVKKVRKTSLKRKLNKKNLPKKKTKRVRKTIRMMMRTRVEMKMTTLTTLNPRKRRRKLLKKKKSLKSSLSTPTLKKTSERESQVLSMLK